MKILFITNIPSPYRVDFFQELGKSCELTVLYELEQATDRDATWKREVEGKSYKEIYLKPVWKQASSAWCPSVKKYLKKGMYDIIVVGVYSTPTGMTAINYLKRHKIPYLLNCDGGMVAFGENALKKKIKTHYISGAAGYLSTAKVSDEYLIYYGADKAKIHRYPFTSIKETDLVSAPYTREEKKKIKAELGITEDRMVITVGQFIPRKGFDILLECKARISEPFGCYIVGGEETQEYREICDKYELQDVHFLPFMDKETLKKYYAAADIFVLPTREDIWGLVINEAMAAGLPIITTDKCVAGVEMVEDGKSGYIIPAEDEKELTEKIRILLQEPEKNAVMADKALDKASSFTIEEMAKKHNAIFKEIIEEL